MDQAGTASNLGIDDVRALTGRVRPVRAEAKVVQLGAQTGIAEGRLTDAGGKLHAWATTTCLIFPL